MMRRIILASIIYATYALQPPFPSHLDVSVTDAAAKVVTFARTESPEVLPGQAISGNIFRNISSARFVKSPGSQNVNRKRKRVRRVYRKPVTVIVLPDVVRVMSAAEVEAERRAKEGIRWVTWF